MNSWRIWLKSSDLKWALACVLTGASVCFGLLVGLFSERNLVRTFFLALAILACGAAYASPWSIASFEKDVAFVVDLGSIEADKDIRSAWVLLVPMDPQSASAKSGVNHDYVLIFEQFDCKRNRSRYRDSNFFNGDECTQSMPEPTNWRQIIPKSHDSEISDVVCGRGVETREFPAVSYSRRQEAR